MAMYRGLLDSTLFKTFSLPYLRYLVMLYNHFSREFDPLDLSAHCGIPIGPTHATIGFRTSAHGSLFLTTRDGTLHPWTQGN